MGTHLSNKYSQKLLDTAKKSTTDTIKTASKRAIQKTVEAAGGLIGNKIAGKITSVSKNHKNNESEAGIASLKDVPKKETYLQKKDNKLWMN